MWENFFYNSKGRKSVFSIADVGLWKLGWLVVVNIVNFSGMIKIRKVIPISHLQAITKASQEKKLPLDGILSLVHWQQLSLVMFVFFSA
jgi:hypothetical protein